MPGSIQPSSSISGPAANRNELWARVLLDELARAGVRDLVLSPGSRSTPLVLAASQDGRFRIRVQIDERSAGFLALGMGKATAFPAAVLTTSGTAVANLLPAVVEAHQSETPLLVLTADRPPRLRGADANQTIDQHGIFGSHLHLFVELAPFDVSEASLRHLRATAARAVSVAVGSPGGVVHLNLPFDTPLEPAPVVGDLPESVARGETPGSGGRPGGAPWTVCLPRRSPPAKGALVRTKEALASARRPLLVAGIVPRPWEVGPILRAVAAELGAPLLADPLSGGRFSGGRTQEEGISSGAVGGAGGQGGDRSPAADATGKGLTIGSYDILLREPRLRESLRPDLVLRFGAAPVSSLLTEWLASFEEVPHILVDEGGRWKDHTGSATLAIPADPGEFLQSLLASGGEAGVGRLSAEPDPDWLPAWRHAESSVARSLAEILAPSSPHTSLFEGVIAAEVAREIPEGEILFVSNSMPVRDLDTFVPSRDASLTVLGNRGASGIDGIVSTAVGASLAAGKRVTALVGDLALLHDANGLASLRDPDARVVLVVVNNDGGGIFQFLPIRNYEPAFTPLFATPQGRELRHLADLHGIPHRAIDLRSSAAAGSGGSIGELRGALRNAFAAQGCQIVEVLTDRRENREVRSRLVHEVAAAAGRLPAVTG